MAFEITGRFSIPLGEYVHFGLGGYFNQSTTNRETDYIESQYDVTDYNYTDSGYNDYDNIAKETSQLKADRNYHSKEIAKQKQNGEDCTDQIQKMQKPLSRA